MHANICEEYSYLTTAQVRTKEKQEEARDAGRNEIDHLQSASSGTARLSELNMESNTLRWFRALFHSNAMIAILLIFTLARVPVVGKARI